MDLTPDQYNTITFLNPSSKDFEIIYGGASYGFVPTQKTKKMPKFLADHCLKHLIDQCINLEGGNTADLMKREEYRKKIVVSEEPIVNEHEKTPQEILQEQLNNLNKNGEVQLSELEIEELHRKAIAAKGQAEADRMAESLKSTLPSSEDVLPQAPTPPTETIPENNLNNQIVDPTPDPVQAPQVPITADNNGTSPVEPTPPAPVVDPATIVDGGAPAADPATPSVTPVNESANTAEPTRQALYDYAKTAGVLDLADPNTMNALENASLPELKSLVNYQA